MKDFILNVDTDYENTQNQDFQNVNDFKKKIIFLDEMLMLIFKSAS